MVLRRARSLLRNEAAAQDAVHEVFLRALQNGADFRAEASPTTWLYRITTNYCLNVLRNESRRRELWAQHAWPEPVTETHASAKLQVAQVLERIRPELQEIACYAFVDGLSQEEISDVLGVSRRTVGYRLAELRAEVAYICDPQLEAS